MPMRQNSMISKSIYERLFLWGHRIGCHQRRDRSFCWRGWQFPICARCTGVLLSYLTAIPIYLAFGGSWHLSLIAMTIMLADWLIQYLEIKESTNLRRLLTGICGGYGIMTAQILIVRQCIAFLVTEL